MGERLLVTGALGNVGREVVDACRGMALRVAGRDLLTLGSAFPGIESVMLDFMDPATWPSAVADCSQVFLLRPPAIAAMNATLIPFIDVARDAGVAHITFLSVEGADRSRLIPHGAVERRLRAGPGGFTILRPGFFAQNLQDAYRLDIVEDRRIYVPAGQAVVAFLDVRDVGVMARRILERPSAFDGQCLTLTGPEAIPFSQVADMLSTTLARPIRYEAASLAGYMSHLRRARGLPWAQIAVQTVLHLGLRRGGSSTVDPTIERCLGRPALSMQGYIDRAAATWMES